MLTIWPTVAFFKGQIGKNSRSERDMETVASVRTKLSLFVHHHQILDVMPAATFWPAETGSYKKNAHLCQFIYVISSKPLVYGTEVFCETLRSALREPQKNKITYDNFQHSPHRPPERAEVSAEDNPFSTISGGPLISNRSREANVW